MQCTSAPSNRNSIAYGLILNSGANSEWNLSLLGVVLGFPGTDTGSGQKGSSTGCFEAILSVRFL